MASLIAPECAFDPWSIDAIADMLVRIPHEPWLHDASLEFGERVLDTMSWQTTARRMLRTMAEVLSTRTP